MSARRFIFDFFMAVLISVVAFLGLWMYIFVFDAFTTVDKVVDVINLMKKEVSLNNGFQPEHMKLNSVVVNNTTWSYTFNRPTNLTTVAANGRSLLNNGADHNNPPTNDAVYTANLYQSLLLDAISDSDVFTDAYVSELTCYFNDSSGFTRNNLQFHQEYDVSGNLKPVTSMNQDRLLSNEECYIAGQKGDWIEIKVVLRTSRDYLPVSNYDSDGITIQNAGIEGSDYTSGGIKGHDIEMTFTVPCMRYVSSGRYIS